jgi:hypothetical protein
LHAWAYLTFKQQNGIVPWNTGTSKPIISDDRRMQKGESNIFCKLGRIVFSNNKMVLLVPWNTGTSKPTISDEWRMQKGESDIFCMLGHIVFSSRGRMDAFLYNTGCFQRNIFTKFQGTHRDAPRYLTCQW